MIRTYTCNGRTYFSNFFRFGIYCRERNGEQIDNPPCNWAPHFLSDDYPEALEWARRLAEGEPELEVAIIASDPVLGFCPDSKIRWHYNRQVSGRITNALAGLINSREADWF